MQGIKTMKKMMIALSFTALTVSGCGVETLWDSPGTVHASTVAAPDNDHLYAARLSLRYGGLMCQTIASQRARQVSLQASLNECESSGAFPAPYCANLYGKSLSDVTNTLQQSLVEYSAFTGQTAGYFTSEILSAQTAGVQGYAVQFADHVNSARQGNASRADYCLK